MTDADIQELKKAVQGGSVVFWSPGDDTALRVRRIGPPPKEKEPEPGECAYFLHGKYAALYNANVEDFIVGVRFCGEK